MKNNHTVMLWAGELNFKVEATTYAKKLLLQKLKIATISGRNKAFANVKTKTGAMAPVMKGFNGILVCSFLFVLCVKVSKVLNWGTKIAALHK